jgi:hypothetical protein
MPSFNIISFPSEKKRMLTHELKLEEKTEKSNEYFSRIKRIILNAYFI